MAIGFAGTCGHASLRLGKHIVGNRLTGISKFGVSVGKMTLFSHLAVAIVVKVPAALGFVLAIKLGLLGLLRGGHRPVNVHHHGLRNHRGTVLVHLHVVLMESGLRKLRCQLGGLIILTPNLGCLNKLAFVLLVTAGGRRPQGLGILDGRLGRVGRKTGGRIVIGV